MACLGFSQDGWKFKPGMVMVSGDQSSVFKDVRGQMLSVNGYRRVSPAKLDEVSVYHAIIFYPEAPIIGGGGGFSNSGPISTEVITWKIQKNPPDDYKDTEEKKLEIKYHALERNVSVGSDTFSLSEGNLFIIRLNGGWHPAAVQIKAHFNERAEKEKALEFFKSALRDDQAIQRLEFY
jgi:hypothetical protein